MLDVKFFGRYQLTRDGRPITLSSQPAQLLFAHLILHAGTLIPREELAGCFWPDSTAANARSNLRHALWRLRQALEPDVAEGAPEAYIRCEGPAVGFNAAAPYRFDVDLLDRDRPAWSLDDLLAAAEAYQGELLPGFYDPWVVLERERLAAVFERRMEQLLNELTLAGQWEEVLTWAEHWIAQGSSPEPAYRAIMRAHAARGDAAQVAVTYRRCREALLGELGVEPSPLTQHLAGELAAGHPLLATWAGPSPEPPSPQAEALAAIQAQAELERRRADLYLRQVRRLNRLAAGLALGLAAAVGGVVALGRRRR